MLAIPSIDIYKGKVTRLLKGNFEDVTYYSDSPLYYAQNFGSIGLEWLHMVDLSASVTGIFSVMNLVKEIKLSTKLKIQFGGGIKNYSNAEVAFTNGVDRIVIGSISITDKTEFEKIYNRYGAEHLTVAIDVNEEMIYVKGWTEKSNVSLWNHLDYCISIGIKYFLCTDISKDGTLSGPNRELYKKIIEKYPQVNLIASGGIGSVDDLKKLSINRIYAAVIGKAIYEKKISLEELKQFAG